MAARALALVGVLVAACAGPDPVIERVEVVGSRQPGYVRVELDVANRSHGHGQVQIDIWLRSGSPPHTLAAERSLELDDHQRLELAVDIAAPDGHYTAEARAIYPD